MIPFTTKRIRTGDILFHREPWRDSYAIPDRVVEIRLEGRQVDSVTTKELETKHVLIKGELHDDYRGAEFWSAEWSEGIPQELKDQVERLRTAIEEQRESIKEAPKVKAEEEVPQPEKKPLRDMPVQGLEH